MILSYTRTIVLYLILIFSVRLMGKRQIGQMSPAEFVVTMLIANLASIPMQDGAIPLYSGLVPILTVLGMELVLSGAVLRSVRLRRLLAGKPVILIDNGSLCQENLQKTRISLDELISALREKNILDLTAVQYAILETNGVISVFPFPKFKPVTAMDAGIQAKPQVLPITIVEDGILLQQNLPLIGKEEAWVHQTLAQNQARLADTFLLTADSKGHTLFLRKEGPT